MQNNYRNIRISDRLAQHLNEEFGYDTRAQEEFLERFLETHEAELLNFRPEQRRWCYMCDAEIGEDDQTYELEFENGDIALTFCSTYCLQFFSQKK